MVRRPIGALIVDDETLAREGIRLSLKHVGDVDVKGEASDGPAAVEAIQKLRPDAVFLDVQIPGFDGFEVLRRVARVHLPAVVFITAYDHYACQAFESQAIDYLLKPITRSRLDQAIERLRRYLTYEEDLERAHNRVIELLDKYERDRGEEQRGGYLRWFTVKDGRCFRVLRVQEVEWIQSALNYIELHAGGRSYLLRLTMQQLEERLDPDAFVRIHRSTMVNVDCVRAIEPRSDGDYAVKLNDGTALKLSRSYRCRLVR